MALEKKTLEETLRSAVLGDCKSRYTILHEVESFFTRCAFVTRHYLALGLPKDSAAIFAVPNLNTHVLGYSNDTSEELIVVNVFKNTDGRYKSIDGQTPLYQKWLAPVTLEIDAQTSFMKYYSKTLFYATRESVEKEFEKAENQLRVWQDRKTLLDSIILEPKGEPCNGINA